MRAQGHHPLLRSVLARAAGSMLLAAALAAPARADRQAPPAAQTSAVVPAVAVTVDQAKVIRLPERTQTVIVGNPMIADVNVQKNGILVVTGKSFGVTNLIALDGAGGLLAESTIRVQAASDSVVTVQRGLDRETYSCTPKCQPSLHLGDSSTYFERVGGQAGKRNSLATEGH